MKFNLDWFPEWSKKNPTDIYGPAIVLGATFGGLAVAAIIMIYGTIYGTVSAQTGPRGTGMSVATFKSNLADREDSLLHEKDPTIAAYESARPIPPEEGEPLAGEVYENAPPELAGLTQRNYDRLVAAMRQWTGIPDLLEDPENYQTIVARRMIQMTQNLNENWSGHVLQIQAGVNCYTCHRGQPVPSNIWFRVAPQLEAMEGWGAVQNFATVQTVSTSLPHDALEKYLLDGEAINVHDLEPRVPSNPSDPGDRTWQHTERTYSLMNYFSNALGVNCVFCHNSRAFYDPAQVTPQWALATLAIQMVLEMNNDYLVPLRDTYPENRLGPFHADAPKAACKTCHKGYNRPLNGADMISDWPELATTGEPVYPEPEPEAAPAATE